MARAKRDPLELKTFTPEQAETLTWEQAQDYMPDDAAVISMWGAGVEAGRYTPFEALKRMYGLG